MTDSHFDSYWCKGLFDTANCTTCHLAYYGEQCDQSWFDNLLFITLFLKYQVGFICLYLVIIVWCIFGFLARRTVNTELLTLYNMVIMLGVTFCVLRVIASIDPYGFYEIYPEVFNANVINISLYFEFTSVVWSIAVVYDVVKAAKAFKTSFDINLTKWITVIYGSTFFVVGLVLTVIFIVLDMSGTSVIIGNIWLIICFIAIDILAFCVLPYVIEYTNTTKQEIVNFIKWSVGVSLTGIPISIGFIILHTVSKTTDSAYGWWYLLLAYLARSGEFVVLCLINMIVLSSPLHCFRVVVLGEPFVQKTSSYSTRSKDFRSKV